MGCLFFAPDAFLIVRRLAVLRCATLFQAWGRRYHLLGKLPKLCGHGVAKPLYLDSPSSRASVSRCRWLEQMLTPNLSLSLSLSHTHTHTHTHNSDFLPLSLPPTLLSPSLSQTRNHGAAMQFCSPDNIGAGVRVQQDAWWLSNFSVRFELPCPGFQAHLFNRQCCGFDH